MKNIVILTIIISISIGIGYIYVNSTKSNLSEICNKQFAGIQDNIYEYSDSMKYLNIGQQIGTESIFALSLQNEIKSGFQGEGNICIAEKAKDSNMWKEVFNSSVGTYLLQNKVSVKYEDLTNDGEEEIMIANNTLYMGVSTSFDVLTFDGASNSFIKLDSFSNLYNPRFSKDENLIISTEKSGPNSSITRKYKFEAGALNLVNESN